MEMIDNTAEALSVIDNAIESLADAKGVTDKDLALARDELMIYSDGECWMLTNGGRVRLRQIRAQREELASRLMNLKLECPPQVGATLARYGISVPIEDFAPVEAKVNYSTGAGTSAKETQVGGDHYKKLGQYQPWEVLAHWLTPEELRGYAKGTAIAYFAREQDKGGDQDIAKGIHTLQLWQEVRKDK